MVLFDARCPILRSSAAVGHSPNDDCGFLVRVDDCKRKSPKQKPSRAVLARRPAIRGFTDCVGGSVQFFDEIQRGFGAAFLIPGNRASNVRPCTLVVLDIFSAHSPWPGVLGAIVPKGLSRPSPRSGPSFAARLPRPMLLARTDLSSPGCRAACSPRQLVPQQVAQAHA
jgi:hypothetical protein